LPLSRDTAEAEEMLDNIARIATTITCAPEIIFVPAWFTVIVVNNLSYENTMNGINNVKRKYSKISVGERKMQRVSFLIRLKKELLFLKGLFLLFVLIVFSKLDIAILKYKGRIAKIVNVEITAHMAINAANQYHCAKESIPFANWKYTTICWPILYTVLLILITVSNCCVAMLKLPAMLPIREIYPQSTAATSPKITIMESTVCFFKNRITAITGMLIKLAKTIGKIGKSNIKIGSERKKLALSPP